MKLEPVILHGKHICLEPLSLNHFNGLCEVGLDREIWRWAPTPITTSKEMRTYVETAMRWQAEGTALPFTTFLNGSNQVVGSTRFANIDQENKHMEIGWTWMASLGNEQQ